MQIAKGTIDCKENKEIPSGSIIFIDIFEEEKVIGHKDLLTINKFPIHFELKLQKQPKENSLLEIQVSVEKGENTILMNDQNSRKLDYNTLENLNIRLVDIY